MKNEDIVIPERSEKEIIETWEKMGALGRSLITEKYTWEAVSKAMIRGYEEILYAGY